MPKNRFLFDRGRQRALLTCLEHLLSWNKQEIPCGV